jgi:alpha-L-rhamnosidase
MSKRKLIFLSIFILISGNILAQLPPVFNADRSHQKEQQVREFLAPVRILWKSDNSILNAENLLQKGNDQAGLNSKGLFTMNSFNSKRPGILLDFGKELQGGLQIVTDAWKVKGPIKLRVRFGESASEAMSDIDTIKGATNDHAMRDFEISVPWLGKLEVGNSGFRFVRIDLIDDNKELILKEVKAIFTFRDIPYLGSFKCSDPLLNQIWETGAYTVHLNMQDYLLDGIKRDRLVWVGDMHPETSTIAAVFGYNEVVPKSLDISRDNTPLPRWMNGISAYSMWWIIIHRDWYYHNGDLKYLKEQRAYLVKLLAQLATKIDADGNEKLDARFLDWPSSENPKGVHAGLQALMVMTFNAGADLCKILNEPASVKLCEESSARLKKNIPAINKSKQAASLMALAGIIPAKQADKDVISVNGVHDFSTFYGYYMLKAKAKAGDYQGAMDNIKEYWGAMLSLGATTFWEDFNIDWLPNASRIDELVPEGKKDIHGDYGAYCYKGFRHSLCHGWASGPTPWLTEYVLGVKVIEPGCKVIKIEPHLGNLTFAEGTFPTPMGIVKIKHTKLPNGKIESQIVAPKGVKII